MKHTSYMVNEIDFNAGSRDPDAEREIGFEVVGVTTDKRDPEFYEEFSCVGEYFTRESAQKVADELNARASA